MHPEVPIALMALMIPSLNLFISSCVHSVNNTLSSNSLSFSTYNFLSSSLDTEASCFLLTMQKMLCWRTFDFREG